MAVGICKSCGKRLNLPETGKMYRCKSCGGTIKIISPEQSGEYHTEMELQLEGESCPSCYALLPSREAMFCPECGHPLNRKAESLMKQRPAHDPLAEHQAARKILRAMKSLAWVRGVFASGALLYSILLLVTVIFLLAGVPEELSEISLELYAAVFGIMSFLMVVGAVKAYSQPFFWSILLASLMTINLFVWIAQLGLALLAVGPSLAVNIIIVGFFWSAVIKAVGVKRLLREYPDIRIAKNLVAVGGKIQKIEDSPYASPRVKAAAKRRKTRLFISIGTSVTLFIGLCAVVCYWKIVNIPQDIFDAAEFFQNAWNKQETLEETVTGISVYFSEEKKKELIAKTRSNFKRFNWTENHPAIYRSSFKALDPPLILYSPVDSGERIRLFNQQDFDRLKELDKESIRTEWIREGSKWRISSMEFPENITVVPVK